MNTNTPVTDEMVKKFLNSKIPVPQFRHIDYWEKEWEQFRSQHSSSGRDWEITCMKYQHKAHNTYFCLQPNGKFVTEDYPSEEFDLHDDLLNNKLGKPYSIHSVRRLSDGEVFSIGDQIGWGDIGNYRTTLLSFRINTNREGRLEFEYQVTEKTRSFCDFIDAVRLHKNHIPPPKPVLFTTEDGKEIFDKDQKVYWLLTKGTWEQNTETADKYYKNHNEDWKVFSSEDARLDYILNHKPCLSVNDIFVITHTNGIGTNLTADEIAELWILAKKRLNLK